MENGPNAVAKPKKTPKISKNTQNPEKTLKIMKFHDFAPKNVLWCTTFWSGLAEILSNHPY